MSRFFSNRPFGALISLAMIRDLVDRVHVRLRNGLEAAQRT
jgi:hypothetical protein